MGPDAAIGVASAVVTFVEFADKLITGACEVYEPYDGTTKADTFVRQIANDFLLATQRLHPGLATGVNNVPPPTDDERALFRIAEQSRTACRELCQILTGLAGGRRQAKWSGIRAAWKSRRKQKDVQALHDQLREFRAGIMLRLGTIQINDDAQMRKTLDGLLQTLQTQQRRDAQIRGRIMKQLFFPAMASRDESICDPERGTFDWILDSAQDYDGPAGPAVPETFVAQQRAARTAAREQYMAWLRGDCPPVADAAAEAVAEAAASASSILVVAGKAGSGKSTLLRHMYAHAKAHPELLAWAAGRTVIFVSFYFWLAAGDALLRSLQGLHRAVLYRVVGQHPDLAPALFPDAWQAISSRIEKGADDPSGRLDAALFPATAVAAAFDRLFDDAAPWASRYGVCFFVDGLDEYRAVPEHGDDSGSNVQHSSRAIAKHVLRWGTAKHVRICCSARPHAEFEPLERRQAAAIRLERANVCDIYRYCQQAFERDNRYDEFAARCPPLVHTLTVRSEGAFLWALLTTRVLVPALARGDADTELGRKLAAIPDEIDALYNTLLYGQADATDGARSKEFLHLVLSGVSAGVSDDLRASCFLWLDDVRDISRPVAGRAEDYQPAWEGLCLARAERTIGNLTRGILEVEAGRGPACSTVRFFHRTAYDYARARQKAGDLGPPSENADLLRRVLVADHVRAHRSLVFTIRLVMDTSRGTPDTVMAFLADSAVLNVKMQQAGELPRRGPPGSFRLTPFGVRRDANDGRGATTPSLRGTTNLGYTLMLAFFDKDINLYEEVRETAYETYSDCLSGSDCLGFAWLYTVVLNQACPLGDWQCVNEARIEAPWPPWLPVVAATLHVLVSWEYHSSVSGHDKHAWSVVGFTEDGASSKSKYKYRNKGDIEPDVDCLRRFLPPGAASETTITLVGASDSRTLTVDEFLDWERSDSIMGTACGEYQLESVVYQGRRVDRNTTAQVACPGLCGP